MRIITELRYWSSL